MDDSFFRTGSVVSITVLCYIVGMVIKASPCDNRFIPIACGITGSLLGLLALYTGMPDFPAGDPITAAAIGAVSGLAATGVDQSRKQLASKP